MLTHTETKIRYHWSVLPKDSKTTFCVDLGKSSREKAICYFMDYLEAKEVDTFKFAIMINDFALFNFCDGILIGIHGFTEKELKRLSYSVSQIEN